MFSTIFTKRFVWPANLLTPGEEARERVPDNVVRPALPVELPHPGVDEGEAGAGGLERLPVGVVVVGVPEITRVRDVQRQILSLERMRIIKPEVFHVDSPTVSIDLMLISYAHFLSPFTDHGMLMHIWFLSISS